MNPAPKDAQEPEEYGSAILLDSEGARLLAVAGEKTAVYLLPPTEPFLASPFSTDPAIRSSTIRSRER
ncbi:hypothetical protein ACETU7_36470 [Rhodococcus sp. 3Y1]